jgi:uncharacterized RDD family membrane protein YckC
MPIDESAYEYVGFWLRTAASLIDSVLVSLLLVPIASLLLGHGLQFDMSGDFSLTSLLINVVLPAVAVVWFWIARQATPGKMVFGARVVDAQSGAPMTTRQSIGRYLGYYVSLFGLGLGFAWVAFDARKQGWHDKLAGTVVIRPRRKSPDAVV